jgi:hypothetical protein
MIELRMLAELFPLGVRWTGDVGQVRSERVRRSIKVVHRAADAVQSRVDIISPRRLAVAVWVAIAVHSGTERSRGGGKLMSHGVQAVHGGPDGSRMVGHRPGRGRGGG